MPAVREQSRGSAVRSYGSDDVVARSREPPSRAALPPRGSDRARPSTAWDEDSGNRQRREAQQRRGERLRVGSVRRVHVSGCHKQSVARAWHQTPHRSGAPLVRGAARQRRGTGVHDRDGLLGVAPWRPRRRRHSDRPG